MQDLMTELNQIFQDVFDDADLFVTRSMNASDVPGWDSLQHVTLILQLESRFGFRFTTAEVSDLRSVGDLHDIILHHLKGH